MGGEAGKETQFLWWGSGITFLPNWVNGLSNGKVFQWTQIQSNNGKVRKGLSFPPNQTHPVHPLTRRLTVDHEKHTKRFVGAMLSSTLSRATTPLITGATTSLSKQPQTIPEPSEKIRRMSSFSKSFFFFFNNGQSGPIPHLTHRRSSQRVSPSSSSMDGVTRFAISPTTSLVIQRGDITKWSVHGSSYAIVNPANERMLGGGGADGAIHRAAGPDLLQACLLVPEVTPGVRCPAGEARIAQGFRLPVAHVIFTVGPIYRHNANPEASLRSAYRNSLKVAKENNIQYIAFPAISCGVDGYPYEEAATVAISTVKEFANGIKEVHFVHFDQDVYFVWLNKANELLNA